jgi:F0F1-type ATP synthase membrane subunit c/vacuolar-type H+-ATPase subunit K
LTTPSQSPQNVELMLRWVYTASILIITAIGAVLGPSVGPVDEGGFGDTFAIVAFIIALVVFFVMRAVMLPALAANPVMPLQNLAIVGYAFAETPAILGLVAAFLSGRGWIALPFGLISLLAIAAASQYMRVVERRRGGEDFPRL